MRDEGEAEEGIQKGVAGDDVRVMSDKSFSSFTAAFSISGSLRRSPVLEREREGRGREEGEREKERERRFIEESMQGTCEREKKEE